MQEKALRVNVATKNEYLKKKIELELSCEPRFLLTSDGADVTLLDIDTEKKIHGAVTMSYTDENADVKLPFLIGEIRLLLLSKSENPLSLIEDERAVSLFGEKIKLTELEYALFALLFGRKSYVSREEILDTVWGNEADGGIINVYVHYLREKLEKNGEKVILSSRKEGYKISERFTGGNENA